MRKSSSSLFAREKLILVSNFHEVSKYKSSFLLAPNAPKPKYHKLVNLSNGK